MTRPSLALAISTMRRPAALEENLLAVMEEARRLGVRIYISDDSPDDEETRAMVLGLAEQYPHIYYHRNEPTLGHDRNIVQTLLYPDADYVWLLADSLRIRNGMLTKVAESLSDQDFLFLNAIVDEADADQVDASKPLNTIKALLWNQGLTGATIYHRRVREWLCRGGRDIKRNFPQLSIILGYASEHPVKVGWIREYTMTSAVKTSYWRKNSVFPNWVDDWSAVVTGFPKVITEDDVPRLLSLHARKTGIFSFTNLLRYRAEGQYHWSSTRRRHFFGVVPTPAPLAILPLLLPESIAALLARVARRALGR